MTKQLNWKALTVILSVFWIISFVTVKKNNQKDSQYIKIEVVPFHETNGWGYEIVVDNKTFIHQEYIPSLSDNRPFLKKEDAIKTGNLVVEKMKNKMSPSITKGELITIGIFFDTSQK